MSSNASTGTWSATSGIGRNTYAVALIPPSGCGGAAAVRELVLLLLLLQSCHAGRGGISPSHTLHCVYQWVTGDSCFHCEGRQYFLVCCSLHPGQVMPHAGHAPFSAGDTMVVAKRPVKEAEAERTVEQKWFEPKWLRCCKFRKQFKTNRWEE